MTDDDTVDDVGEVLGRRDEVEVGKAAFVIVSHVHAAVEHHVPSTNRYEDAAAPDILPGTKRHDADPAHRRTRH